MTVEAVTITVPGIPQPKGSLKAFRAYRSRRVVVTSDNPKLRAWHDAVVGVTRAARGPARPFPGAVVVSCTFVLPRPASYPRRVVQHTRKPDLDKLVRAVLDALAASDLFGDDAAVVGLHAWKSYVIPGVRPGVTITVEDATALEWRPPDWSV